MKRNPFIFLILGTMLLLCQGAMAQKELVVMLKGGNKTVFTLASSPVITVSGDEMTVKSDIMQIVFRLEEMDYYSFSDTETAIHDVSKDKGNVRYTDENVFLYGLDSAEGVSVYTINGKIIETTVADSQGTAQLHLTSMPKGSYIIKSKTHSFKILKK